MCIIAWNRGSKRSSYTQKVTLLPSKTLKTTSPQELFALTCLIQSQILLFDEAKNAFLKHESYSRFGLVGGEEL